MTAIQTQHLTGAALDWAVGMIEDAETLTWKESRVKPGTFALWTDDCGHYHPSEEWELAGPIIERELIATKPWPAKEGWKASIELESALHSDTLDCYGPTPLIAAMRAYVHSRLGPTVDVPEELV